MAPVKIGNKSNFVIKYMKLYFGVMSDGRKNERMN